MLPRPICAALAALVVAAVAPAAASADSIVYLKNGTVWIANSDGSGARQFTTHAYNWHSPSEADDGTVVVAGGLQRVNADGSDSDGSSEIYRFRPDGNQIGTYTPTYGSYSTPACPAYPPSRVRVSPDGSKIAYSIYGCGDGGYQTALWTPAGSTGLNFPNQTLGQQDFWNPIWIDSSRFTISHQGMPTFGGAHWGQHAVGDGDHVGSGWYEAQMDTRSADAVISRDGTTAAVFFSDAAQNPGHVSLGVYHNAGMASDWSQAYGNAVCQFDLNASAFGDVERIDPSLSPDGTKVLWGDNAGVELKSLGDVANGCAGASGVVTLIPGGSEPFYAKGNLQQGAANPVQPGPPVPPPPPPPPPPVKPVARFVVATKKAMLRKGRKITLDARRSGESNGRIVAYRWSFGDRRKGSGRKVTHAYRKPGTYTVSLTVVDAGGRKATAKHKVTIRR